MSTPKTTEAGEREARDRFGSTDPYWDENGTVSVYLPRDVAERLLAERGWEPTYADGQFTHHDDGTPVVASWTSPNGHHEWATGDALQIALTAEN